MVVSAVSERSGMEKVVLARFMAQDGTGLWEVGPDGVWVNGQSYEFTATSRVICRAEQGRSYESSKLVEEEDDFGLLAALAVYQETHSLEMAGLAAWALGGTTVSVQTEKHEIPGTIQLSIGGLSLGDNVEVNLRYREDGQNLQVAAVQHFANMTLAAIKAYRAACAAGQGAKANASSSRPQRRRRQAVRLDE